MKQARMGVAWALAGVLLAGLSGCGKKGDSQAAPPGAPGAPGAPANPAAMPPAPGAPGAPAAAPDATKAPEAGATPGTPAPAPGTAPATPGKPAAKPAAKAPDAGGTDSGSWFDKDSGSSQSAGNTSGGGSGSSGSSAGGGDSKPAGNVGMPVIADSSGFKQAVAKLKGKVVVVNFWATWCPPCVAEFPGLVQTRSKLASKGVSLLTISGDETSDAGKAKAFLSKHGATSNGYLLTAQDSSAFAGAIGWSGSFPATLIFDRSGQLVETLEGEQSNEAFESAISKHL